MAARRKSRGQEKHRTEFLSELAIAILKWQQIEAELFFIFTSLVQGRLPAMSAVFHSVVNFNARLEMIDEAAAVMLNADPLKPQWDAIFKRLKKRAAHRNKLVHFTVMGRPGDAGDVTFYLSQSIWDHRDQPRLEYDVTQIKEFSSLFEQSRQELQVFGPRLRAALSPSLQKFPEPRAYESRIRIPRFRTPKARKSPPRSSRE